LPLCDSYGTSSNISRFYYEKAQLIPSCSTSMGNSFPHNPCVRSQLFEKTVLTFRSALFFVFGGAEGGISRARMLASRKGQPPRVLPQNMREVLPSNSLGSASRTPDPKTASRAGLKITILELSPGFPFLPVNQGVCDITMIASITMIMPVWTGFSTILAQWIHNPKAKIYA